jgi:hypothetical protein
MAARQRAWTDSKPVTVAMGGRKRETPAARERDNSNCANDKLMFASPPGSATSTGRHGLTRAHLAQHL